MVSHILHTGSEKKKRPLGRPPKGAQWDEDKNKWVFDAIPLKGDEQVKRLKRNAEEKSRVRAIDETVAELKEELGIDPARSKADTLELTLQQLRRANQTNAVLNTYLSNERQRTSNDNNHFSMFGDLSFNGFFQLHGASQPPSVPSVHDMVQDMQAQQPETQHEKIPQWESQPQDTPLNRFGESSGEGSGTGCSRGVNEVVLDIIQGPELDSMGFQRTACQKRVWTCCVLVAMVLQIMYSNCKQSLAVCIIALTCAIIKPTKDNWRTWIYLWRLVGYPIQCIYQHGSGMPVETAWPRVLLWPYVSLLFVQTLNEHVFFSLWFIAWLAVATNGAITMTLAAAGLCAVALSLHMVEEVSSHVKIALSWVRSTVGYGEHMLTITGSASGGVIVLSAIVNLATLKQGETIFDRIVALDGKGWFENSVFSPNDSGLRLDGTVSYFFVLWLIVLSAAECLLGFSPNKNLTATDDHKYQQVEMEPDGVLSVPRCGNHDGISDAQAPLPK